MTATTAHPVSAQALPDQKISWGLKLLYTFIALFLISLFYFAIFQPIKVLPRVSLAPGFAFRNQDGAIKTSEDYRSKLTIYNFTYSGCAGDCAPTSAQMQDLHKALEQVAGQDVQLALVTISLDPANDSPESWKNYAAQYLPAAPGAVSWDFLTGEVQKTKYVVGGGFSLYYKNLSDAAGRPAVQFQPRFVLVDGWGIIRAEYRTAQLDIPMVLRDISYLRSEIRNSSGVARYAYEAAHLFRCYP